MGYGSKKSMGYGGSEVWVMNPFLLRTNSGDGKSYGSSEVMGFEVYGLEEVLL